MATAHIWCKTGPRRQFSRAYESQDIRVPPPHPFYDQGHEEVAACRKSCGWDQHVVTSTHQSLCLSEYCPISLAEEEYREQTKMARLRQKRKDTVDRSHGGKAIGIVILVLLFVVVIVLQGDTTNLYAIDETKLTSLMGTSAEATPPPALQGWKPIDVFYGDPKLAELGSKSQAKQDVTVLALLSDLKGGYFLDLAANDAVTISNTFHLETSYDWNGICVEPNPIYWSRLAKRKCHVAAAVVSKERMEKVQFKMMTDKQNRAPSGGIEDLMPNRLKGVSKEKAVTVYTVKIQEILEKYNAPKVIEYLSLDVEGAEFFVMKDFPYETYKFKIMTVERPTQELIDLLYEKGYVYLGGNNEWGEETLFYHSDYENEIKKEAVTEIGWLTTSTKWVQVNGSEKPTIIGKQV